MKTTMITLKNLRISSGDYVYAIHLISQLILITWIIQDAMKLNSHCVIMTEDQMIFLTSSFCLNKIFVVAAVLQRLNSLG